VLIEALATGTPVAAYRGPGADRRAHRGGWARWTEDLDRGHRPRADPRPRRLLGYASHFGWNESARQFLEGLVPIRRAAPCPAEAALRDRPYGG
jgi:hypothetical protein